MTALKCFPETWANATSACPRIEAMLHKIYNFKDLLPQRLRSAIRREGLDETGAVIGRTAHARPDAANRTESVRYS